MSITDYYDDVDSAARQALLKSKAIKSCALHSDVTIRVGDSDRERHAYALATLIAKSDGTYWMMEDIRPAIKDQLEMAADGECPICQSIMES